MSVWIVSSSVIILAVLCIRLCFGRQMGTRLRYALWAIVLLRLLIPVQIGESRISAVQLEREIPRISAQIQETVIRETQYADLSQEKREALIAYDENDNNPYVTYWESLTMNQRSNLTKGLRMVWGLGMAIVGSVMLVSNIRFYRRLRRSRVALQTEDCPVAVYRTEAIVSPCLFGFPIPSIYLTSDAAENPAVFQYVLMHEKAHLFRGDSVFSFLRCLCLVLHWYHPLVWIAAVLSKQDCELACDASVIRQLGDAERFAYGRTLLQLSDPRLQKMRSSVLSSAADAAMQSRGHITERVKRIASYSKPRVAFTVIISVLCIILMISGFTDMRTQRIVGSVAAPDYVKKEALRWAEEIVAEEHKSIQMDVLITKDWQVSALEPVGTFAPVAGRELEIWYMEYRSYSDYGKGTIANWHWSVEDEGNGWRKTKYWYYLAFDAEDKSLVRRYTNYQEMPGEEDAFYRDMLYDLRYYDSLYRGESRDGYNIAGLTTSIIRGIVAGEANDPYHYVGDICYKVEFISASTHESWGEEQLWRVIVNDTGEEVGRVRYYPEHDDIAVIE